MTDNPFIHLYTYFAYTYGGTYVDAAYRDRGNASVAALFDDLPVSSRQVIARLWRAASGWRALARAGLDEEGVPVNGSS